jgi:hypothetical protein
MAESGREATIGHGAETDPNRTLRPSAMHGTCYGWS